MNAGGELTGRIARELAVERQRRLVELVDAEVIRRALSGCPSVLAGMTQVERELVIAIADMDGFNHRITAEGLGLTPRGLGDAITSQRRRVGGADAGSHGGFGASAGRRTGRGGGGGGRGSGRRGPVAAVASAVRGARRGARCRRVGRLGSGRNTHHR